MKFMKLMKSFCILLVFPILVLCSCSQQSNVVFNEQVLSEARMVEINSVLIKKDIDCIYPVKMSKIDSLFFIQDLVGNNIVNAFNRKGEYLDCMIKKGQGPNDVTNVTKEFVLNRLGKIISVYSKPYLTEYDINKFMNGEREFCMRTDCSSFGANFPVMNACRIDEGILLAGFTKDMRYAVIQSDSLSDLYKNYPSIINTANSEELIPAVLSYSPCIGVDPTGKSWVQGTYIGGTLEGFNISEGVVKSDFQSFIYPSYYEAGAGINVSWGNETIIGFEDIVITSGYIYTLLNGTKGRNLKSTPPVTPFPNKITVFDKQGNVVKIIKTDCMMMALDIDEDENKCYVVTYNGEQGYDLREIPLL